MDLLYNKSATNRSNGVGLYIVSPTIVAVLVAVSGDCVVDSGRGFRGEVSVEKPHKIEILSKVQILGF